MTVRETPEERAERYERGDIDISPNATISSGDEAARRGRAVVESALDADELAELDAAIRRGRPSLGQAAARGESPKRQVRLPEELDRALTERAKREHRKASAVIRDALTEYLRAS
ncbi:ribbon-helix-helix protein, CopG family [Microbacterium amylolyticum]|uniref:Transcriptional regulator n=1 Tax=Microbacterium amylolyticum TaxID=936337 RepID=A0ABS4ZKP4_9MICO|nr:ribbon-helix-helix protein, CopG family [Microbacterium amylolyticum]MBP2437870.1 putative transcriptional regulator [Microbacterium amylolyticum]